MKSLLLASLALFAASSPSLAAKDPVYALTGARIVTVSGAVLENATLVMDQGLITAVGADAKVPLGARILDGKGLTITPGFIDGFGKVGLAPSPPRTAGQGQAAAPGPGPLAPAAMVFDRIRIADAAKARDAGITSALVVPEDGVLPGQSVFINTAGERPESMVVLQPFAQHLHMATVGSGRYPGSLMGTMAYARQALLDAAHYRDEWAAYERAPKGRKRPAYDPGLAAWRAVIDGKEPLVVTARRENDVRRALSLRDEFKIRVIVAGAMQAAHLSDLVKAKKLPLLVSVNYDPPMPAGAFDQSDVERDRQTIADAEQNPAALHRAGVSFALVSGHGRDFVAGVRKAIDKGLPKEAALRAITLAPAEVLGVSDRLGSVETGKIANVVAWSGEPLAKDTKAKYVFVDGRLYEPEDSDAAKSADGKAPDKADDAKGKDEDKDKDTVAWTPAVPPQAPAVTAITGATLLTVSAAGRIENGTILIRDGRIAAVGKDVAVPKGATVIDAAGRFVTPGSDRRAFAHRCRRLGERVHRFGHRAGAGQRRHRRPRHRHLPPAGRRRHHHQRAARLVQRDRRPERDAQAALGTHAGGAGLQGGAPGHQVRARREPEALQLPCPRPAAALPRHAHGRRGRDPRGVRVGARLQAGMG